jgi:hypothetical protein
LLPSLRSTLESIAVDKERTAEWLLMLRFQSPSLDSMAPHEKLAIWQRFMSSLSGSEVQEISRIAPVSSQSVWNACPSLGMMLQLWTVDTHIVSLKPITPLTVVMVY